MPESTPWDDIAVPDTDFNVRQVGGQRAVPCNWGRNSDGECLFLIDLLGDHTSQYRRSVATAKGIGVDLRSAGPGLQRLVLTLERHVDRDLFAGLCRTLSASLADAPDSASALGIALTHIRRWKHFLSGRGSHLSPEEVRGLFAELQFLSELIGRQGAAVAVAAWLGPERSHQDFIFGNTAVEVKSLSGTERNSVRISSEDQLESLNDRLFLRIYRLSSGSGGPQLLSLNGMVAQVQGLISDPDAADTFERRLVTHGYAPLPEYDEPAFVVSKTTTYHVRKGFPRMTRSGLPDGIMNVGYEIKLEAIADYECDERKALEGA